jgi:hypothetical protein
MEVDMRVNTRMIKDMEREFIYKKLEIEKKKTRKMIKNIVKQLFMLLYL